MTAEEISQLYDDLKAQYAHRDVVGHRLRKVLTNNYHDEIGFLDLALPGQEPLVANLVGAAARITAQRVGRYPRISVIPAHRSQLDKDVRKTEAMELQLREDLERTGFRATLAQAALWMVSHGVLPLVVRPSVQYGSPVIEVRDPLTLYCVDPATEILTRRGWRPYLDLVVGEDVAGFDMATGNAQWTPLRAVNVFDFDGKLQATRKKGLSMRLTPDHRSVVYRRTQGTNRPVEGPFFKDARDLDGWDYVPQTARWERRSTLPFVTPRLAAVCGWVAAEGCYSGHEVTVSQSTTVNPTKVKIISALLGAQPNEVRPDGCAVWHLNDEYRALVKLLMPGKKLGAWCFELSKPAQKALLRAFIQGDGSKNGTGFSIVQAEKNRQNLDVLQVVALMQGWRATLSDVEEGPTGPCRHLYLSRGRQLATSLRDRTGDTQSLVPYQGKVWCPTTGLGTWVARRDGCVFITGNCDTVWPHRPEVSSALYVESMVPSRAEQLYPGASASLGEDVTNILIGEYFGPEGVTVVGPLGAGHADVLAEYPSILPFVCSVCRRSSTEPTCPNCGRSIARPLMTVIGRGFSSDLSFEGQFESTIPLLIAQAKMFGLMMSYLEQNVFPETNIFAELQSNNAQYAVGPGAVNQFAAGPGARVEKSTNEMSPQVFNELDRFERAIRIAGGFPAQMSGEPVATIATGKGIEELTATVDDNVNYWQTVVQDTLIKAMMLFSDTSIAFGGEGSGLYLPRSSYRVGVRHLSSSDPAQLVGMLQQVDSKLVSRATVRAKLDSVDQPEIEEVSIETEQLRDALLQGVLQRSAMPAAQGGMDPKDVARLIRMRREGAALEDAVERLAAEAQQAATPAGAPAAPASISQLLQKAAGDGQGGQPPAVMTPGGARSLERQMSIPPQQFTLNQEGAENNPPYAGRPPTLPSARTLPNV